MKTVVACIVIVGCLCGLTAVSQAEEKLRIGVIDARKVLAENKMAQQRRGELEKMVKERRETLAKEESNIKALVEKLEKDKLVLTDKQREQKEKEIQDRGAALQKMAQDAQQEVAKREQELFTPLDKIVREAVDEVATKEKLMLVVDRNQTAIHWIADPVDITDKVVKAVEAKSGK